MTDTTINPAPETQPPTPPKKRHRIRNTLLIIGSTIAALIIILVIVAVATSGGSPKPIAPPAAAKATAAASAQPSVAPSTPPPSTSSVSQFGQGHGFKYSDGTIVTISSVTPTTLSQEAAGGSPGDPAAEVTVRITAGKAALDASEIQVDANGGPDGTQLSSVVDNNTTEPSGTLAPGETGTYTFEFDLQHTSWGSSLDLTVVPGFSYSSSSFKGAMSGS